MSPASRLRLIRALPAVFALIYLLPIGFRPMIVPDEVRYAQIPREMIAAGDWIVPRLNGLRYFEKPVMGYWLNALSMKAFGETPFAVRFPAAAAAGFSALLVLLLARRSGSGSTGTLAALIFLTCFLVVGTGVFSVLDGILALFLTAAMTAFYHACSAPRGSRLEKGMLALFGAACGLAFLTKGFLAFAVPVVVIVPFLMWQRRWTDLLRMAPLPVLAALLVCLPWAVAVHLKEPDYWNYFFWEEHIKRFMADDAQHEAPFWTYLAAFPAAALPWSFLIPASVTGIRQQHRNTPLFRYCVCWFVFPLLFFSAASGKLLTYILPCFPPFATLTAMGLTGCSAPPCRRAVTIGTLLLLVLFSLMLLGLAVVQLTGIGGFIPYRHGWKSVVAGAALAGFVFCLWRALKAASVQAVVLSVAMGLTIFLPTIQLIIPDDTIEHKSPGALLIRNQSRVRPDTVLVSLEDPLRAVCWFYRRSDVYQLGPGGELAYGFDYPDSRHRLIDVPRFIQLINEHEAGQVVLVGKSRCYRDWETRLPAPRFTDTSGPGGYVFAQY